MKKVKQERFYEERLTMEHVTDGLYKDINEMHVRSNVDSAKKLACIQHMDYTGFS